MEDIVIMRAMENTLFAGRFLQAAEFSDYMKLAIVSLLFNRDIITVTF